MHSSTTDRTAAVDHDVGFGRLLHRLRKERDLTQAALAQQAYCALDTIKKIEAGVRRPARQLAPLLADGLSLAGAERAAFLQPARAEPPERLAVPAPPLGSGAAERPQRPAPPPPAAGRAEQ